MVGADRLGLFLGFGICLDSGALRSRPAGLGHRLVFSILWRVYGLPVLVSEASSQPNSALGERGPFRTTSFLPGLPGHDLGIPRWLSRAAARRLRRSDAGRDGADREGETVRRNSDAIESAGLVHGMRAVLPDVGLSRAVSTPLDHDRLGFGRPGLNRIISAVATSWAACHG